MIGYICLYKNRTGIIRAGNKVFYTRKAAEASARNAKTPLYDVCKIETKTERLN